MNSLTAISKTQQFSSELENWANGLGGVPVTVHTVIDNTNFHLGVVLDGDGNPILHSEKNPDMETVETNFPALMKFFISLFLDWFPDRLINRTFQVAFNDQYATIYVEIEAL
jgi:hypothetical protein